MDEIRPGQSTVHSPQRSRRPPMSPSSVCLSLFLSSRGLAFPNRSLDLDLHPRLVPAGRPTKWVHRTALRDAPRPRMEWTRWRRCKPQATIRTVSFSLPGRGLSQNGQGSGCALHLDHLDTRLSAPIGLGGEWASHRSNEMTGKPGTGRGGQRAAGGSLNHHPADADSQTQPGKMRSTASPAQLVTCE